MLILYLSREPEFGFSLQLFIKNIAVSNIYGDFCPLTWIEWPQYSDCAKVARFLFSLIRDMFKECYVENLLFLYEIELELGVKILPLS